MQREHRVRITWSPEYERRGLPDGDRGIDPAWIATAVPVRDEGWTLAYRFERPPQEQGNPSEGFARFVMETAPEHWLRPGAELQLFERGTGKYARVEVLD